VPAAPELFEGHFPGDPILPGFVQLDWVLGLARAELGALAPPAALEGLRFRSPLRPGQEFDLRIDASPGRLVFELGTGGREISFGRLSLDPALAQHRAEAAAPVDAGAWPLRLPHAGRMRLLERVLGHEAGATVCEALVTASTPLVEAGRAPAWLALELLAQAMAAHGGLAAQGTAAGRRGYLVGVRRVELRTRSFAVGERLWARAEQGRGAAELVAFECALGGGAPPRDAADAHARALARGSLRAYLGP
jgi:predicted hotdog family 3-hydroxylacyl-ACP dehydratase